MVLIVAPFFLSSLVVMACSASLLLFAKEIFKQFLPSRRNIVLAVFAMFLECLCFCFGVYTGQYVFGPNALWFGKVLSLCALCLFIKIGCSHLSLKDLGVSWPEPKAILSTLGVLCLILAMAWNAIRSFPAQQAFSWNKFLFMLTISGVDEELVFRGLVPALLLIRDGSRKVLWINKICVFLLLSIIFSLFHALRFSEGRFYFNFYIFSVIGFGACAFMYLRLRTSSLLNSILVHNIVNAGAVITLAIGGSG